MHQRALALILVALGVATIPFSREARAATGRVTVDVAGQKRTATLIEFGRLKRTPRTTIIVLRGASPRVRGASTDRRGGIGLSPVVRNTGALIVYPDALDQKWALDQGGSDDPGFIRSLASKLVADGLADKRRIFLAGVSTGGVLALRIACEGADYLAGVSVMIANMPEKMAPTCKPAKPLALMVMNGTADPLMPWQGGTASLANFRDSVVSTDATMAPFAMAASCGPERTKQEAPDRDPADGSRVIFERLNGCKVPVELARVDGGGHTLPGRPARADRGVVVGAQNNDVNTPRVLWDFVQRVIH